MMATQWGRKETIIWPPHVPLMSYSAVAATIFLTCVLVWQRYSFQLQPLQKAYLTDYIRAEVGSTLHAHQNYRLLYLGGDKTRPRLAFPIDFAPGSMTLPNRSQVRFTLSDLPRSQGYTFPFRAPAKKVADNLMYGWFHDAIFDRESPLRLFLSNFLEAGFMMIVLLVFAVRRDLQRFREMKYGRRLRGPLLLTPDEFNRKEKGDGIGFKTTESRSLMRIPKQKEPQHFQVMGDTGVGKSQLIMQILRQIREREDSAIVYDPACEYIQRFYNKDRGDVVLNPLDRRCPYWGPAQEMASNAEAEAIATSLYAPKTDRVDEFFHETPAQIFAHLLRRGPTPHQLAEWMASEAQLMKLVKGTEMAFYIDRKAGPQRAGVLSSLGLVAKSFRLLPTREQAKGEWNARAWSKERKGWIFITSRPPERDTLRPLFSLWIDLLVMRLMTTPAPGQKAVWFVIDELASLQKLPQLHTALTEARKSSNPIVLGFQGKAQLETIYGHMAEVMLSQPATKIYMKTSEPKAAEWISESLGKVEIERLRETKFDGTRAGKNFTLDRQVEPLVMASEIGGLDDRHAYLKVGNNVARFAFDYLDLPTETPGFLERKSAGGPMTFDPDTLTPINPAPVPDNEIDEVPDEDEAEETDPDGTGDGPELVRGV